MKPKTTTTEALNKLIVVSLSQDKRIKELETRLSELENGKATNT